MLLKFSIFEGILRPQEGCVEKRHLQKKKKSGVYFTEKMDEVRARNKIEVEIRQEKVDFINDAYEKELRY